MGNMTVSPSQLNSYRPESHAVEKFHSKDNWYSESVKSLESGASGWTPVQLSPTLNMAELKASADGPPGWSALAIKQGDKITIIHKGDDGNLRIASSPEEFESMNEIAHIPGIRSSLLSGHATAWRHETTAVDHRSAADLKGEIDALRKDRDLINSDLQALEKAKSSNKLFGSQAGLLNSMRKDLDARIERLEELRSAAKAREAQAARAPAPQSGVAGASTAITPAPAPQSGVAGAPTAITPVPAPQSGVAGAPTAITPAPAPQSGVAGAPTAITPAPTPAAEQEPEISVESDNHDAATHVKNEAAASVVHEKAIEAWLDRALDLAEMYAAPEKQADLQTPKGREAYQNARSELDAAYARDMPESLIRDVTLKLIHNESSAPSGQAPNPSSKLGQRYSSDIAYAQERLEEIDAIANRDSNTSKPVKKTDDASAAKPSRNIGPTVEEILAAKDPLFADSPPVAKKQES